ncbi:MAG: MAPEG family protein [Gammaproteobacteria bacterium]|nr:MAPEG family protein [Gammaproteobacteria bacterium]
MPIAITAFYAGLLGLLLVALSYRVAQRRIRFKVGVGAGDHPELERAIRVHGNFIEYVPFTLLLLALYEAGGGPGWVLHGTGIALVAARLAHAVGLTTSAGRTPGRFAGTLVTWLVIALLSLANMARFAV